MMAMNLRKNSRFFSQLLDINSLFVPKIHSTAQHSTAQHSTITLPETIFRAIRILNQTHRATKWLQHSQIGKLPVV